MARIIVMVNVSITCYSCGGGLWGGLLYCMVEVSVTRYSFADD